MLRGVRLALSGPAGHGCGALLLRRASLRPRKRQTAAPAPLRLFLPQAAPQLRSPARVGASPLRHSAKRCATSPAGGGKRTCVSFGKVCGKAKLQKVHLTTNFPFANGRKLGSPSGRAGETPARAARLRGEPPTRAGEVPPQAAERARTERGAARRGRGIIKARTIERPGLYGFQITFSSSSARVTP